MFSIFKKSYPTVNFSYLDTDMHSHLLPGIDDGSADIAQSNLLKRGLEDLGFKSFVTTPHIMWDMYKNTPATVAGAFSNWKNESSINNLRFAAEYFLDDHFKQMVTEDEPLLTIREKKILVEFSFVALPLDLSEQLFNLQIKGYQPIIAHPERYAYLAQRKSTYDELRQMGCLMQLNLLSLEGYYGKLSQDLATWLLSKNYIDLLGTDLHHDRHLEALRRSKKIMPVINKLLDSGQLQNPTIFA